MACPLAVIWVTEEFIFGCGFGHRSRRPGLDKQRARTLAKRKLRLKDFSMLLVAHAAKARVAGVGPDSRRIVELSNDYSGKW